MTNIRQCRILSFMKYTNGCINIHHILHSGCPIEISTNQTTLIICHIASPYIGCLRSYCVVLLRPPRLHFSPLNLNNSLSERCFDNEILNAIETEKRIELVQQPLFHKQFKLIVIQASRIFWFTNWHSTYIFSGSKKFLPL